MSFSALAAASFEWWQAYSQLKFDSPELLLFAISVVFTLLVYIVLEIVSLEFFPQRKPLPILLLMTFIVIPLTFVYLLLCLHEKEMVMESNSYIEDDLLVSRFQWVVNDESYYCLLCFVFEWIFVWTWRWIFTNNECIEFDKWYWVTINTKIIKAFTLIFKFC